MRVKRGVKARRRRKRLLSVASGFRGRSKNTIRQGRARADKSLTYRFRDRRALKRNMRSLWIARIGAAARGENITYSRLINGLKRAGVTVDRKVLSEIGAMNPVAFKKVVEVARTALEAK